MTWGYPLINQPGVYKSTALQFWHRQIGCPWSFEGHGRWPQVTCPGLKRYSSDSLSVAPAFWGSSTFGRTTSASFRFISRFKCGWLPTKIDFLAITFLALQMKPNHWQTESNVKYLFFDLGIEILCCMATLLVSVFCSVQPKIKSNLDTPLRGLLWVILELDCASWMTADSCCGAAHAENTKNLSKTSLRTWVCTHKYLCQF